MFNVSKGSTTSALEVVSRQLLRSHVWLNGCNCRRWTLPPGSPRHVVVHHINHEDANVAIGFARAASWSARAREVAAPLGQPLGRGHRALTCFEATPMGILAARTITSITLLMAQRHTASGGTTNPRTANCKDLRPGESTIGASQRAAHGGHMARSQGIATGGERKDRPHGNTRMAIPRNGGTQGKNTGN